MSETHRHAGGKTEEKESGGDARLTREGLYSRAKPRQELYLLPHDTENYL